MQHYPLIFLHIPKTAGTSLRYVIENNYSSDELFFVYNDNPSFNSMSELRGFSEEDFCRYKIIMGHFPFSGKLFPFDDCRFVTMLREPVSRCISYYHHVMSREEWRDRKISLFEYLRSVDDIQLNNHQTRLLAGMNQHPITGRHLESAIRNIEKYFLHVGLSEYFPRAVDNLGELLGWKKKKIFYENVTRRRLAAINNMPKGVLQMLNERNEYDIKLYEYVTSRLEQS